MKRRYLNVTFTNLLFNLIWWVTSKFSLKFSKRLMSFGIRDGAFPIKNIYDPVLKVNVLGLTFKNPIGVAAGIDKKGTLIDGLIQIGFGFGEFGSYTLEKEMPNSKAYYLMRDKAILMQPLGYRNPGISKMIPVLTARRHLPHIIGINIATSTPFESENVKQGHLMTYEKEFTMMAQKVAPYCDYIVLNFSHPDTELSTIISDKSTLLPIIKEVKKAVQLAAPIQTPKVLVKLPLDITPMEVRLVCNTLTEGEIDGVIVAGGQSLSKHSRKLLQDKKYYHIGVLSGKPVFDMSTELIRRIYQNTMGKLPIIACGGVFTGEDALEKITAGASLVQIHTSLIFEGPNIVNRINKELGLLLREKGYKSVMDAIGADFN